MTITADKKNRPEMDNIDLMVNSKELAGMTTG